MDFGRVYSSAHSFVCRSGVDLLVRDAIVVTVTCSESTLLFYFHRPAQLSLLPSLCFRIYKKSHHSEVQENEDSPRDHGSSVSLRKMNTNLKRRLFHNHRYCGI